MIWIFRFLFVLAFLDVMDVLYGVSGLILSRFSLADHPMLHKIGIRCLAMSVFFCKKFLPTRCRLDCQAAKCGNWTCPRYHTDDRSENPR